MSCNAPFDDKKGSKAKKRDWQRGTPVRVIRSHNASKISNYAPEQGYRYDGIYKVVKYYLDKEQEYEIWKFVLKRDDLSPSPWSEDDRQPMELGIPEMEPPVTRRETAPSFEIPNDVPSEEDVSTQKPFLILERIDVQTMRKLRPGGDLVDTFQNSESIPSVNYQSRHIFKTEPYAYINYNRYKRTRSAALEQNKGYYQFNC